MVSSKTQNNFSFVSVVTAYQGQLLQIFQGGDSRIVPLYLSFLISLFEAHVGRGDESEFRRKNTRPGRIGAAGGSANLIGHPRDGITDEIRRRRTPETGKRWGNERINKSKHHPWLQLKLLPSKLQSLCLQVRNPTSVSAVYQNAELVAIQRR